jgi:hypothetical protein
MAVFTAWTSRMYALQAWDISSLLDITTLTKLGEMILEVPRYVQRYSAL